MVKGNSYLKIMKLIPKTKAEMERFFKVSIEDYAQGLSKAYDKDINETRARSKNDIEQLFKTERENETHKVLAVIAEDGQTELGGIWYMENTENKDAYIFQILIYEEYRGKGFGKAALDQFHEICKREGLHKVSLSVFGWNHLAFEMYKKANYKITRILMRKLL